MEQTIRDKQRLAQQHQTKSRGIFPLLRAQNNKSIRNSFGIFVATDSSLRRAIQLWLTAKNEAISIYGHICTWDTSKVTDMRELFQDAIEFNDPIGSWNVTKVKTMVRMFQGAS